MPEYMADYPQCVIDSGLIHPDSAEEFKAIHQQLKAGATCVELDIKVTSEGGEIQWKRVKYTTLSEGGEPATQALGTSEDITAQKIAEEKFYKQMSYKNIMEQNVMASFHLNLTKNTCGDGQSAFPFLLNLQEDGTVDGLFRKVMKSLPQGEQREAYGKIFGRENMLRSFAAGERHLTYEHKYQVEDGRFEWIVTHGNLMENPVTKEVEALLYAFNVHEQKIMKDLFSKVVAIDYDYIIQLNGREDSYIMYYSEQINSRKPSPKSNNYSQTFSDYCKAYVISEDPEKTAQSMNIETIKAELEDKQTYNVVLKIREKDNSQAIKKLQYSYIDKENELIMLTRSDVTEMFQKEEKKAEALRTALVAARQANTAKTDFLSRMSHEIRTPMNAIIGMSTIAAQSIGNNDRIVDCISKIGISSHFLLSLINDILDMSRIESGKMLLRQEEFAFADFLSNVNSICHAQTAGKGIAYECIVDHTVDGFYVGDSVKLQQILINILSNAVKFTPEEGKITLRAEKINTEKAYTTLRFSVKDTGCGIEAEFLPYIFDAFSQEDSGKTTKFGGTGLGLAICKNLVSLMDGRIDVNSIVGVGTEFIVEVKLENSQREELALAKQPRETFPNLEILVVDDDLIVCESATATLEEMGINASWVDSGAKAIAEVKKRKEEGKPYDILLVDWKMPEMNGIETTREIRKIVGPEVTIIIMTAYEWVQIEHEAKLAGVNLMMSKPMFKASMVSALHNVLGKKEENDTAKKIDFDFTGKKVLLVEDHPLNVEVAKQLLSRKGFQVEHAENGVMAIE
ncbi:MAG: ATP-binding protein, partial [Anaerovoracaceae bacterium]